MKRKVALSAALLSAALVACQVLAGIERSDKEAAALDAGPEAAADAARPPDPCAHALPPGVPDTDDDALGQVAPFYLAFREMRLGAKTDAGTAIGFDLDGTCTCDSRPATAYDGGPSCIALEKQCDEPDSGVDNQLFKTLEPYAALVGDIDNAANVNDMVANGILGLLIYVVEYNGLPNDRLVRVGGVLSDGVLDGTGCGSPPTPLTTPQRYTPGWCGGDKWMASFISVLSGTNLPALMGDGYVNGGQLVFEAATIQVYFGATPLALRSVKVTGRLAKVEGRWRIDDGIIAGRADVSELLKGAGVLRFGGQDASLCSQETNWLALRSGLCSSADMAAAPPFDFTGEKCTSISLAFAFKAEQATVVPYVDSGINLIDPSNPCRVDKQDAAIYACPP